MTKTPPSVCLHETQCLVAMWEDMGQSIINIEYFYNCYMYKESQRRKRKSGAVLE